PVENVVVAIADRGHLDARQIGPRGRFRQKLPTPHLARVNRRQKPLLLLFRPPDANTGTAHLAAAVVVRGQANAEPRGLLLQYDDLVQVETSAAVLLFTGGIQPAFGAKLPAERAASQMQRLRLIETPRTDVDAVRHILGEPGANLVAELFLRRRVFELEFHGPCPSRAVCPAPWRSVARRRRASGFPSDRKSVV